MRELNGNEDRIDAIQNGTLNKSIDSEFKTINSTEKSIAIENVLFKKTNSKKSKINNKKEKKNRVNRKILTTLLSRKKLYKLIEHKLDM